MPLSFQSLRGRPGRGAEIGGARVPEGLRVYAIGDVHGRRDLLERLDQAIVEDFLEAPPGMRAILVYVGDYIDRGLESRACIEHLLRGPPIPAECVFLKGNHEDALLRFLEDPEIGPVWFSVGGNATVLSYGVRIAPGLAPADRFAAICQGMRQRIPPEHIEFFRNLKVLHGVGDYLFVHAGLRPGVALEAQREEDLLWIRDEFLESREDFGAVVVHGHSPTNEPEVRTNRIGIDTGAFATNRLTALVLEGEERRFLATPGR